MSVEVGGGGGGGGGIFSILQAGSTCSLVTGRDPRFTVKLGIATSSY